MSAVETLLRQNRTCSLTNSQELYTESEGQGLPLIQVKSPLCQAVIALHRDQLFDVKNSACTPLLWLSPQCQFNPGSALRGGIPLCLPWFGPHPTDASKPQHGYARTRNWELTQVAENDEGRCELTFELVSEPGTLCDYAFTCVLRMTLSRHVEIQLSVTNRDSQAFDFSWAFHSYFPVRILEQARVKGLAGRDYRDNLEQLITDRKSTRLNSSHVAI